MTIIKSLIIICLLSILSGCGVKMTAEDYEMITDEFTDEIVFNILESEDLEFDAEYEQYVEDKLDEVSLRYSYTSTDYMKKARSRGEDWDTIWERIGERVWEFLEIFWEEIDEDSLDFDLDEEVESP